jgi:alpha-beta hydrolase superfamily lysophospholipase
MNTGIADPVLAGFMGAPDKQLFYCYHAPCAAIARPYGLVLCPPAGREYVFTHRTFWQLANRLTRAGFPVLRFDYFASGDSAGEDGEGNVEQWLDDIAAAVRTFRDHSCGARVCLAGFRVGASLAVLHAVRHQDVDRLILWDPVVDGDSHVDQLLAAHRRWQRLQVWRDKSTAASDGMREVVGFLLSPRLEQDLRGIDLGALHRAPARRALLLRSRPHPDADDIGDLLSRLGVAVDRQHVPWPEFWVEGEELDDVLMPPARVLQALVAWAEVAQP